MSIFGAMSTAVLGLEAQARALGHISDNIANSQTTGYKRVDTTFQTLVLQSSSVMHSPGGVKASPSFANNIQGTLQQVQSVTNLALQGQGFFSVSRISTDSITGTSAAATLPKFYTRDGTFELDKDRYLVNANGYALNGWTVDPTTGGVSSLVTPIQVTTTLDNPVSTAKIELKANLPASPPQGVPIPPTSVQIFDAQGSARTVNLIWRQQGANQWRLNIDAPGSGLAPIEGSFPGFATASVNGPVTQGQAARAQVDTFSFSGPSLSGNTIDPAMIKVGDIFTMTVKGTPYAVRVTLANIASLSNVNGVAAALADQINSAVPSAGVTATTLPGGRLVLSSSDAGNPFAATANVENTTPTTNTLGTNGTLAQSADLTAVATTTTPQQSTLTFNGPGLDVGDVFSIAWPTGTTSPTGTSTFSLTIKPSNIESMGNINGVVSRLAEKINSTAGSFVIATTNGESLILTAKKNAQAFIAPTASVSNGSTTPITAVKSTEPTNVVGVKQRQTISLAGTMGDVGAVFSVNVKSPISIPGVVAMATAASSTAAQVSTVSFSAATPAVGQEYRFESAGTKYSILVTEDNLATLTDMDAVANALAQKINDDGGSPATAATRTSIDAAGAAVSIITLTAEQANVGFTVATGSTPTPFNRTFQYRTTGEETTLNDISTRLASMVNAAGIPVTASASGGVLTVSSTIDGGVFTATPRSTDGTTPAHIGLTFGGTDPRTGVTTPPGTLRAIDTARVGTGTATTPGTQAAGQPSTVTFRVDYGFGPQEITIDLGKFQESGGLTQFAGETMNVTSIQQNGSPRGTFKDVEISDGGDVIVNFDNGTRKTVARVPVVMFTNPNGLEREDGGLFRETLSSGTPTYNKAETNGAGSLVVSSLESSNVDIADEFTKLIITQRTYSANTKVVTTSDEMLQEIISLKR